MTPTQQTFDLSYSQVDKDLLRTFKTLTMIDKLETFSSDDFRMYGLDRFLRDTQHGVGGFFAKMKHNKDAEPVGRKRSVLPSNNMREIRVWKWIE